ncbi:FkbM family methyltransferase [Massilia haematophila]|uniref:FkbM family methyltransferase n=1 Tax=Massilia haematophila TaxID=457923 RepID=A0ABV7PNZ2_9BURK
MERQYRSGLDIDVALATAARRAAAAFTTTRPVASLSGEPAALPVQQASIDMARTDLRGRVKRWLRRPAAITFRLLKPFLRPVAFRTRRYLTEALHQDTLRTLADTQREVQRASAEVLREVQSAREMLRHEIISMQGHAVQEQQILFTGLLQEQQATRDLVRRLFAEDRHRIAALLSEQAGKNDAMRQALADAQQQLAQVVGHKLDGFAPQFDRLEQYAYASARRALMHCAADEVMVKTEAGYVMCSDTDLALLATLIDTGDLERGTRLLIQQILQPGDTFVDVGANVGLHTLAAGRALQGRGRIVAFEPFAGTRRLLDKTLWINGLSQLTEVHGKAVWDREGVKTLFLGATSGHHSLFELGNGQQAAPSVEVSTVTLEAVLGPACHVDLLKIDAEGAELEVLRGALSIVQANPDIALIVEFGPLHLHRNAHTSSEWLAAFTDLGLEYRAIDAHTGALSEIDMAALEAAESTNLFFSRPGARLWPKAGDTA